MAITDKVFIQCDECKQEECIDETGECALPCSELIPDGWQMNRHPYGVHQNMLRVEHLCPKCAMKSLKAKDAAT